MAIIERQTSRGLRYQVRVRDQHGRQFTVGTFARKTDAEKAERQTLIQRDLGQLHLAEASRLSVGAYIERWKAECRRHISQGWKISQDQMLRDYILPALGDKSIGKIAPHDIAMTLNRVQDMGIGAQTRKHVYTLLHKLFADAIEEYALIKVNPVQRKHRPYVPKKERAYLPSDQAWKLLEAVRDHYVGPAIWLGVLSGLRPGEAIALQWQDIDWDENRIIVRRTYSGKLRAIQEHPKQQDWGEAPMPQELRNYLWARRGLPKGLVATRPTGLPVAYESYCRLLRLLCKETGVTSVSPHELRHTAAMLYLQAGASEQDIRILLNHSSEGAVKHYIHRSPTRLRNISLLVSNPEKHDKASVHNLFTSTPEMNLPEFLDAKKQAVHGIST